VNPAVMIAPIRCTFFIGLINMLDLGFDKG
jgi:hypothetical protein